jgi:hypothetical protein
MIVCVKINASDVLKRAIGSGYLAIVKKKVVPVLAEYFQDALIQMRLERRKVEPVDLLALLRNVDLVLDVLFRCSPQNFAHLFSHNFFVSVFVRVEEHLLEPPLLGVGIFPHEREQAMKISQRSPDRGSSNAPSVHRV